MPQKMEPPGDKQKQGMDLLRENIPGGMFQCLHDETLTILQMNDEFLKVVGYTREEVQDKFHNNFREMIDERDLQSSYEEAGRQLLYSDTKALEYRIKGPEGKEIWVLDKGKLLRSEVGPDSFCCLLIDISRNKKIQEQYRLSLERHQIIVDQTNDIIFEWDIRTDQLEFSGNWYKKFGYHPMTEEITSSLAENSHIYEKDKTKFLGLLEQIRQGEHYAEAEIRLLTLDNAYIWCRVRLTGQEDEKGRNVKAVGVIIDIDNEKRQEERLRKIAQIDMLTKLYNKGTCERLIEDYLKNEKEAVKSALFIMDVDDFKRVNDNKGHLFGDAFLAKMAGAIKKQFRSKDIIGRIGGDEFMIFLKDIPDAAIVHIKAGLLLDTFSCLGIPEMGDLTVSCSIGIALAPEHGSTLQELYHNADLALYRAKRKGKNTYVIYGDAMDMRAAGLAMRTKTANGATIDSDEVCKTLNGRLIRALKDMRTILDNQNCWIYVIRHDTYQLMYINQKTMELVPEAVVGMKCHKAFFHSNEPCQSCPVKRLGHENKNETNEVYNPILKVWSAADASWITWEDQAAILLSCLDITAYKNG